MDLTLTEPQEMLRAAARSFVAREVPTHAIVAVQREASSLVPALWHKAAELGWPGILVPAEYGGGESTLTDAAVLFEGVAITDPNTSWGSHAVTLRAQRVGQRYRLDGTKLFVADATAASHLLVAVRTGDGPGDVSLLLVEARAPGVSTRRLPGFLSWRTR
jgi:alkylation response protein AidB-like acyl-CoA dehydrogenase